MFIYLNYNTCWYFCRGFRYIVSISDFIFDLGTERKEQQTTFQVWKWKFQSSSWLFQFEVAAIGGQDQKFGHHSTALGPIGPKVNNFSKGLFRQVVPFDFTNCRLRSASFHVQWKTNASCVCSYLPWNACSFQFHSCSISCFLNFWLIVFPVCTSGRRTCLWRDAKESQDTGPCIKTIVHDISLKMLDPHVPIHQFFWYDFIFFFPKFFSIPPQSDSMAETF